MEEITNVAPDGEDKKIIIEIKDKNYIEKDEKKSFVDVNCQLIVRESDEDGTLISEEEKNGVQIKGRDCIYLNAPNIYFPQDAPLDTKKRELYDILNELFQLGSGDDWQPPDWWLEVPEPEPYEMYFLVLVLYPPETVRFTLSNPVNVNTGGGNVKIDWGDGTVYDSAGGYWGIPDLVHRYSAAGQYLVKVTTTDESCFFQEFYQGRFLIAKIGSEIVLNNDEISEKGGSAQNAFYNKNYLFWAVINCKNGGLPRINAFRGCSNLRKVNIAVPPKIIGHSSFMDCKCLKRFDFSSAVSLDENACQNSGFAEINAPLCESIGNTAFGGCYNLRSVNAPICASVGNQVFLQCYDLRKAVFAGDCIFGSNCFENCVSLYPRPDGSVT